MIEKAHLARMSLKPPTGPDQTVHVKVEITTEFSDKEAVRLLSRIAIDTPFDEGKTPQNFRILAG